MMEPECDGLAQVVFDRVCTLGALTTSVLVARHFFPPLRANAAWQVRAAHVADLLDVGDATHALKPAFSNLCMQRQAAGTASSQQKKKTAWQPLAILKHQIQYQKPKSRAHQLEFLAIENALQ